MDWATFVADCIPTPDSIVVEAYTSGGNRGPTYAAAVTVTPCVVQRERKRVPVATADAAGAVAVSTAQVWCPPGTVAPPDSRVTLADGRPRRVLMVADLDAHGHELPEHVELALE